MKNPTRKNLNDDIYQRFGISLDTEIVRQGFYKFIKNEALDKLKPIVFSSLYESPEDLYKSSTEITRKFCRQNFIDYQKIGEYSNNDPFRDLVNDFFDSSRSRPSFNQYITYLQILINIIYESGVIRYEFFNFIDEIKKYFIDFPILGLQIKVFKTLPPKIIPSVSKKFDQEVSDTLGLLEKPELLHVMVAYEDGLKSFLMSTTKSEYKNVIEDMYTSCDELIKVILNNKSKGFRQVSDKEDSKILGLNGYQKEFYKNLRNWMDEIKHGTDKNFNREETEMIISLVSAFISYIINKC